ncbi:MAG: redox-regulated ATPase YchF [Ardenticatenaceae bacterium]|nr:redox-regulated ATPase YchF [Ardenticatenaceae bacterium]MCB9442682.1 redox-regulated ATPase YchF [Ardenticatenaceae bacterium]
MALSIGLVGLPNVGKSTTFNALTKAQNAEVANYPFCTIKPNKAIVAVPDIRVDKLADMVGVPERIHATIEFVDIAGLVKGASQGEGLGNQFLGNVRDTAVLIHVVRCFDDPNVVHISAQPDPVEDIAIVNLELALADLEQLERKIEKLTRQIKGDRKVYGPLLEMAEALQEHLAAGRPIHSFSDQQNHAFLALNQELRFLTGKPVIYAANVDEDGLVTDNDYVRATRAVAAKDGAEFVKLCAQLEEAMIDMSDEERQEYFELSGISESGLAQIIRKSFHALGLINFFTKNENEVRAWEIRQGSTAPQAAGTIHTDFERGFIRAEVIPFDVFARYGGETAVKAAGAMRVEGKEYIVQDGDIILFRFNI